MRVELLQGGPSEAVLARLAGLHEACFGVEKWGREQIAGSLSLETTFCWVVFLDDVVQGFLLVQATDEACEVLTFCVGPLLRRRGLGRALLEKAFSMFPAHAFFLEVAADNVVAQKLYEAMGFALIGRRPRYYQRRGESEVDALCFRRMPRQVSF